MMELINTVLTDQTKYLIEIFIVILGLEMISGVLKGIKFHKLNSPTYRSGLLKKTGYFVLIALVLFISIIVQMPNLLYSIMICVSCAESISILENLEELGVNFPAFLKDILEVTKKKTENEVSQNKENKEN